MGAAEHRGSGLIQRIEGGPVRPAPAVAHRLSRPALADRMTIRVHKVSTDGLLDLIASVQYPLVRLDRSPLVAFHRGVAEFFEAAWPDLVQAVTFCRADASPQWLDQVFRTAVGPIRTGVKDGYYLFEAGVVVGYHSGVIRPAYAYDPELPAQLARVRALAFRDRPVPEDEVEAARQVTATFDPILTRKQRPVDAGHQGGFVREERERAGPAPPSPYEVLGVARSATDEEIKAAWRQQMKENHPDRVAHLSKALQAFALAQTLAIQKAYEALRDR